MIFQTTILHSHAYIMHTTHKDAIFVIMKCSEKKKKMKKKKKYKRTTEATYSCLTHVLSLFFSTVPFILKKYKCKQILPLIPTQIRTHIHNLTHHILHLHTSYCPLNSLTNKPYSCTRHLY